MKYTENTPISFVDELSSLTRAFLKSAGVKNFREALSLEEAEIIEVIASDISSLKKKYVKLRRRANSEQKRVEGFLREYGFNIFSRKDYIEAETRTDGGAKIQFCLSPVTIEEMNSFFEELDCDDEITSLRESSAYRMKFTLKQSVEDIYGFYERFREKWEEWKSSTRKK